MERVERAALEAGVSRSDPRREQPPDRLGLGHALGLVAGHEHDLPAPPAARDIHDGDGARWIAVLHGGIGQPEIALEDHVEHEPWLVQAEVLVLGADGLPDDGPGAVAADHPARAYV